MGTRNPKDDRTEKKLGHYSFVDMLERVGDGVHIDIVNGRAGLDTKTRAKERRRTPAKKRRTGTSGK